MFATEAEEEWKAVRRKLHFYEPSSRPCDDRVVDPKDLPYMNASAELGLPVYTRDKDLKRMGAPVLWVCIDTACRDHARATSVTLGFTAGSTFSLTIGAEALGAAIRGMKGLYEAFRKQPAWLQVAVAGALAAIVIHPRSRAKISELWKGVSKGAVNVKGPLLEAFLAVMKEIATAQSSALRTKREIEFVLPPTKKVTALVYARRICVIAESPISSDEIVRRMRSEGYVSRGKRPQDYLRRVLRESGEFIELPDGMWQFRLRSHGPMDIVLYRFKVSISAFPAGLGVTSTTLVTVDPHFKDPYLQQWNFAVQRELASGVTVTVGYTANHGSDLRNSQSINQPPAGPGDIQSRRPFPDFSSITSYENIGESNYESGYVKAEKRFSGGFGFLVSYTFAKLLDTGGIVDPGDLSDTLGRNPLDPSAEYGRDFFDARHRLVGSWVWQLPVGKGKTVGGNWPGYLRQTIGNWQLNGILALQSGLPISPILGFDNSNTGNFRPARPDTVGDPNSGPRTVNEWFNTSAFALPAQFSYGNTGRNTIDGPPIKTLDLSLFKNFDFTESKSLQFRAEFFNSLNHPNFNPPGTTFGTASFGVISSAADPS
jgi:hypothetical protein